MTDKAVRHTVICKILPCTVHTVRNISCRLVRRTIPLYTRTEEMYYLSYLYLTHDANNKLLDKTWVATMNQKYHYTTAPSTTRTNTMLHIILPGWHRTFILVPTLPVRMVRQLHMTETKPPLSHIWYYTKKLTSRWYYNIWHIIRTNSIA